MQGVQRASKECRTRMRRSGRALVAVRRSRCKECRKEVDESMPAGEALKESGNVAAQGQPRGQEEGSFVTPNKNKRMIRREFQ